MPWMELPNKKYFRPDEVAEYFSISVRTVYRLVEKGDLAGIHLREKGGGALRIPREAILDLEERGREFWGE